jgi:hypothetical protein
MHEDRDSPSKLILQPRDYALLVTLFESRIMTRAHATALHFDGSDEAAKKRIQKLKAAGLIGERRPHVNRPALLFLTGIAFKLLRSEEILSEYPSVSLPALEKRTQVSEFTIRHELEVMDVKAAFHTATKSTKFTLTKFCTWPLLNEFTAIRSGSVREALVKPDGFITVKEPDPDGGDSEHTFFLELDRSSESQEKLVQKALNYLEYYKSGGFAVRNGAARSAYREFPFRVLLIFKTAERRNNTARELLHTNPPILTQACLTTLAEVTTDPLGPIWICPREYRDATHGTPYGSERPSPRYGYKRETAREKHVEGAIKKFRLLD